MKDTKSSVLIRVGPWSLVTGMPLMLACKKCSILGVGCFGVVFSARVRRVDVGAAADSENLALKIVLASDPQIKITSEYFASNSWHFSTQVKRRESRELSLLKRLNHPNVVRLRYFFFRCVP